MDALIHSFDHLPRGGATTYGFTVGLYPIVDYPTLSFTSDRRIQLPGGAGPRRTVAWPYHRRQRGCMDVRRTSRIE